MRYLARQAKTQLPIRELALKIVAGIANKDYKAEAEALHQWVQSNIRYTRDIHGVETVQTPLKTLEYKAGDCDDHATLLAALLESIGHPARFVAIGYFPGQYAHVFTEAFVNLPKPGHWMTLETTEPWRAGKQHAPPASRMVVNISKGQVMEMVGEYPDYRNYTGFRNMQNFVNPTYLNGMGFYSEPSATFRKPFEIRVPKKKHLDALDRALDRKLQELVNASVVRAYEKGDLAGPLDNWLTIGKIVNMALGEYEGPGMTTEQMRRILEQKITRDMMQAYQMEGLAGLDGWNLKKKLKKIGRKLTPKKVIRKITPKAAIKKVRKEARRVSAKVAGVARDTGQWIKDHKREVAAAAAITAGFFVPGAWAAIGSALKTGAAGIWSGLQTLGTGAVTAGGAAWNTARAIGTKLLAGKGIQLGTQVAGGLFDLYVQKAALDMQGSHQQDLLDYYSDQTGLLIPNDSLGPTEYFPAGGGGGGGGFPGGESGIDQYGEEIPVATAGAQTSNPWLTAALIGGSIWLISQYA